jgi:hypothetical protein
VLNKQVKRLRLLFSQYFADMKLRLLGLALLMLANIAFAAPKQVTLIYQAIRNDKPFATVTETYHQSGDQYKIESVTEGIGVYALFGKRILKSDGLVTPEGLKPIHFESNQADNAKKTVIADFDWAKLQLTMKSKGNEVSELLPKGTQDLVSYPYQWMHISPLTDEMVLPVTTGKKIKTYRYNLINRDDVVETPAGQFKVVELTNGSKVEPADERHFWLAVDHHYLPVRILMQDDKGAVIEQILTSIVVQ